MPEFADRTRAFLKIQEGCNNFCTFCIIPVGPRASRSRKPENVLRQARQLVEAGYKEIVLTGIHTGGYGEDLEDYSLADLLVGSGQNRRAEADPDQFHRGQPDRRADAGSVECVRDKMCRHLHIPLQAGDDEVLKRMRRKYTVDEYAGRKSSASAKRCRRWPSPPT